MKQEVAFATMAALALTGLCGAFSQLAAYQAPQPEPGTIITVAGSGPVGPSNPDFGGDGGPAIEARLGGPWQVTVDAVGNLYVADSANNRVRKISREGIITTVAGTGPIGLFEGSYAGDGGPAVQARLSVPQGVGLDVAGNLYIGEIRNQRVRKVSGEGIITTVAGSGPIGEQNGGYGGDGGPAIEARLNWPLFLAVDAADNLYIADFFNHRVRKVSPDGIITTVAGDGKAGFRGDGGLATEARLNSPTGVAVDGTGNLFISDGGNNRVRKVGRDGIITTVAGKGGQGFSGDGGLATEARLNAPMGLAVDTAGALFIVDHFNQRVRKVGLDGIISTVAGSGPIGDGKGGFSGDGGPATQAMLQNPHGVAVDARGNLLIGDTRNLRVRKVFGVAAPGLLAGRPFPQP